MWLLLGTWGTGAEGDPGGQDSTEGARASTCSLLLAKVLLQGGKPPCLPVFLVLRTLSPQLWLPWHVPEEVSVAGLAISFPLGRAGSLEMGGLPFPGGRSMCVLSQSFGTNFFSVSLLFIRDLGAVVLGRGGPCLGFSHPVWRVKGLLSPPGLFQL